MEILHFKDLGDTKVSLTNAVWVLMPIHPSSVLNFSLKIFISQKRPENNFFVCFGVQLPCTEKIRIW